MKKLMPVLSIAILFIVMITSGCKKDKNYDVKIRLTLSGTVTDSTFITYKDETSTSHTESISTLSWTEKSFTVTGGYNLYVKLDGEMINGTITLTVSALNKEEDGYDESYSFSSNGSDFDHLIDTYLD